MKGINKSIDKYCRVLHPSAAKMKDCRLLRIPVSKCADLQPIGIAHISDLCSLMYFTKQNSLFLFQVYFGVYFNHTNSKNQKNPLSNYTRFLLVGNVYKVAVSC